jgi:hypothetical protein
MKLRVSTGSSKSRPDSSRTPSEQKGRFNMLQQVAEQ